MAKQRRVTMRGAPYAAVLLLAFAVDAAETLWMTHRGKKEA